MNDGNGPAYLKLTTRRIEHTTATFYVTRSDTPGHVRVCLGDKQDVCVDLDHMQALRTAEALSALVREEMQ